MPPIKVSYLKYIDNINDYIIANRMQENEFRINEQQKYEALHSTDLFHKNLKKMNINVSLKKLAFVKIYYSKVEHERQRYLR